MGGASPRVADYKDKPPSQCESLCRDQPLLPAAPPAGVVPSRVRCLLESCSAGARALHVASWVGLGWALVWSEVQHWLCRFWVHLGGLWCRLMSDVANNWPWAGASTPFTVGGCLFCAWVCVGGPSCVQPWLPLGADQ